MTRTLDPRAAHKRETHLRSRCGRPPFLRPCEGVCGTAAFAKDFGHMVDKV